MLEMMQDENETLGHGVTEARRGTKEYEHEKVGIKKIKFATLVFILSGFSPRLRASVADLT
jgi:hypothetical protein